ncbi:hypothetical protein V5799_005275 [Amblyomma americanum]|uniref:Uncharacterized protein n=1 Tax=Amblyomma americanum TaxID=6943 RepID=A0AAQ4DZQ2_AMBAM
MLPSAKVAEEKPDAAKKAAVKEDGGKRVEEMLEPGDDTLELLQSSSPSSMTPASPASPSTSPFMPSSQTSSSTPVGVADLWSSAPNAQGGERSVDSYTAWASQLMSGSSCRLLRLNETLSPEEPSSVADKSVVNFYDSEFQAQSYGRNLLQKYSLIQSFLNQLDDHFWTRRSIKANQFILASLAALLSEMVVGDTLGEMLAPVVVRVVAYGVFLKCTAVLVIVASMNSLGTMFFSSEPVTKSQAWYTLDNATHIEGIPLP